MLSPLDHAFSTIRRSPFLYRLTLFTRILLAAGFIPTGLVKLLGQRFTSMGVETPIGAFFEAMFQTGFYWQFLGASQILAGVLLLFPALAHLGAAAFLPIMLNIFVITVSIDFGGTPYVTGAMLLAVVYLCFWDFDRFRPLLSPAANSRGPVPAQLSLVLQERVGFTLFAAALLVFFLNTRFSLPPLAARASLGLGLVAGLGTFVLYWTHGRKLGPTRQPAQSPN